MAPTPTTCFTATRLNKSTFCIVEDDKWDERPLMYVKVYDSLVVIIDAGVGVPKNSKAQVTSLRQYIERFPVAANDNQPLNPDGAKSYLMILTHCHIGTSPPLALSRSSLTLSRCHS